MKKIAFVIRKDDHSLSIKNQLEINLVKSGMIVDEKNPDLIICVGGDGTILYAVHKYLNKLDTAKFIGVHTGTLGFFTEYTDQEIDSCIHDILSEPCDDFTAALLEVNLIGDVPQHSKTIYALNEMRIENIIRTQVIDVYIDGEHFEKCRGTGVCLSTQVGSTAYNRSLGGAVIDSGLSIMQLSEITSIQHSKHHSLGVPYIMMRNRSVTFMSDTFNHALLCYDHLYMDLENIQKVVCTISDRCVHFARYRPYSYLKRLKNLY